MELHHDGSIEPDDHDLGVYPHCRSGGVDDGTLEYQVGQDTMDIPFDAGSHSWLGDMIDFTASSSTGHATSIAPSVSSAGDSSYGGGLAGQDTMSYISVQDGPSADSGTLAGIASPFQQTPDPFQLDLYGTEHSIAGNTYTSSVDPPARDSVGRSSVTISVEDCDRDTLDQLMGIARVAKGKVKIEINS